MNPRIRLFLFLSTFSALPWNAQAQSNADKVTTYAFLLEATGYCDGSGTAIHQLGYKVKGLNGIVTPASDLLKCERIIAFDHDQVQMSMRKAAVSLDGDLLVLVPDFDEEDIRGMFKEVLKKDAGLPVARAGQAGALQFSRSIEKKMRSARSENSMLSTAVLSSEKGTVADLKSTAMMAAYYPQAGMPIVLFTVNGKAKDNVEMISLTGSPVWVDGDDPALVGMVGEESMGQSEAPKYWYVPCDALNGAAFGSVAAQQAEIDEVVERQCAHPDQGHDHGFIAESRDTADYKRFANWGNKRAALHEALLRIRDHMPTVKGERFRIPDRKGETEKGLCGTGWLDLSKYCVDDVLEHKEGHITNANTEYAVSVLFIKNYSNHYCSGANSNAKLTGPYDMLYLIRLNRMMSEVMPADQELLRESGIDLADVQLFAKQRLAHYLNEDFLRKVGRELDLIDLFDDCREVPGFINEMKEWAGSMDPVLDKEAIAQLAMAGREFSAWRTGQVDKRYKGIVAGGGGYEAFVQRIAADSCLDQQEKKKLLEKLKEDGHAKAAARNQQAEDLAYGATLEYNLIERLEKLKERRDLASYTIDVRSENGDLIFDIQVSPKRKISGAGRKKKREGEPTFVTDSVSLCSYSFPLASYCYKGAGDLLVELGTMLDSVASSRDKRYYIKAMKVTGSADGVPVVRKIEFPPSWYDRLDAAGPDWNKKLALARALAADEILKTTAWRKNLEQAPELKHVTTKATGEEYRNVRVAIAFGHRKRSTP